MLNVIKKNNFNGISNKVNFEELKNEIHIDGNYAVELYENEKIINLNIPHGEIYSKCTDEEWDDILRHLQSLGLF